MLEKFAVYSRVAQRFVDGYTRPEALNVLRVIDAAQRAVDISGPVAEIGVHHGQLFIGMRLLQREGERSLAIDLFGDQERNIDHSGAGDLKVFRQNVERWASLDGVVIHEGDSTRLDPATVRELAGGPIRLFSVDGGHTESVVLSDMRLAEGALADGGIVIADDVFHPQWPGVAVGTISYMKDGALVPFVIGFNKVLFTQPHFADKYRAAVEEHYNGRALRAVKHADFAGHPVAILSDALAQILREVPVHKQPVQLLRRSATARAIYHRIRETIS